MANLSPRRFSTRSIRWCAILGLAAGLAAPAISRAAESSTPIEIRVKAAFLYKFSGYVEWPDSVAPRSDAPVVFGVIGADPIAEELARLIAARGPDARPASVVRIKPFDSVPPVHILFIGRSQADRLPALIRTTRGRPILVVTDSEEGLEQGSMVNFTVIDGHVRFGVGLGSARENGLGLSARLLAVAQSVVNKAP